MGPIKVVTYRTPSHNSLYEIFNESLLNTEEGFDRIDILDKDSASGDYGSKGFNQATMEKFKAILDVARNSEDGETILYSDVDVVFLKETTSYISRCLEMNDVFFQDDASQYCTGFFCFKNKPSFRDILSSVVENKKKLPGNDQDVFNSMYGGDQRFSKFDPSIVFNTRSLWNSGDKPPVFPETMKVFHANWTIGVDNKEALMKMALDAGKK